MTVLTLLIMSNSWSLMPLASPDPRLPPVHREAIILGSQNLWCNIVGGATESGGGVTRSDSLLAHPIVCQLDVTLVVQQHVVQLQVPVDDPSLVQVVQGQADFRAVEPCMFFR